jgi:hypothetical protein
MLDSVKKLISPSPDASFAQASDAACHGQFLVQSCWCMWYRHPGIPDIPVNLLTLVLALYGCTKCGDVASSLGLRLNRKGGSDAGKAEDADSQS